MSDNAPQQPPGWYYAQGDPPGTQRYWDGQSWIGTPQPVPGAGGVTGQAVAQSNLADPGMRILARLIDFVIWIVIAVVIGVIFGGASLVTGSVDETGGSSVGLALLGSLIGAALVTAYEVVMVGTKGGTAGKLALGMRVVNADGTPADMQTGLRRMYIYIGTAVLSLIPLVGLIGFLVNVVAAVAGLVMLFTDSMRQTPWDKVGKTIVVPA